MGYDWISIVSAIVGLTVLFAGLVVAARGSYNKARLQALREDLDDSRARELDRQKDVDNLRHDLEITKSKLDGVARENTILKDLVTQRVEIGVLQGSLESHHHETMEILEKVISTIEEADRHHEQ